MHKIERPIVTKTPDDNMHESVETHPSYAQIGASRCQGGMMSLYGSDFQHHNYMTIRIYRSEVARGLSHDWHHAHDEMIEVALSEAQWATFVSTPNSGMGVPCTLQHIERESVPQLPPPAKRTEQFTMEATERLQNVEAQLKKLIAQINASKLTQKAKDELLSTANYATNDLRPNIAFVAKSFAEHVERITEHAKIEVSAYVTATINRAGLKALGIETRSPIELPPSETDSSL